MYLGKGNEGKTNHRLNCRLFNVMDLQLRNETHPQLLEYVDNKLWFQHWNQININMWYIIQDNVWN